MDCNKIHTIETICELYIFLCQCPHLRIVVRKDVLGGSTSFSLFDEDGFQKKKKDFLR
jgi:hypothetical protein